MILLLGDIHGHAGILKSAIEVAKESNAVAIIQLGDFGLYLDDNENWFRDSVKNSHIPIYFIDGNHDDCDRWTMFEGIGRIWNDRKLYYVPRGTVMEVDGRTIAVMGGASSINKKQLLESNMPWTPLEDIRQKDIDKLLKNAKNKHIDMFLTHIPPHSVIQEHFDDSAKLFFEVGLDWHDQNQTIVEELWHKLGTPNIYSGHMHRRVQGMTYRILDINELLAV